MSLKNDLTELTEAGLLTPQQADNIRVWYRSRSGQKSPTSAVVLGVLGAAMIGIGIIMILAHNWDELSRSVKTLFAFLPLLLGQGLCVYTFFRRPDSRTWSESSSVFLVFAIGACIALISQIYNIPGNIASFMVTWLLLSLPLVYLFRSSAVSLLYWAGATFYACETNYWDYDNAQNFWYYPLISAVLPHYYYLCREKVRSWITALHHLAVALSVAITLGIWADKEIEMLYFAYFSLFGLYYMTEILPALRRDDRRFNGYVFTAFVPTTIMLFAGSFREFWRELIAQGAKSGEAFASAEFALAAGLTAAGVVALFYYRKEKDLFEQPYSWVFVSMFLALFLALLSPVAAAVWVNLLILTIAFLSLRAGFRDDLLLKVNFGLVLFIILVFCRISDGDLTFTIKGIISILLGLTFFAVNFYMLRKRRQTEAES